MPTDAEVMQAGREQAYANRYASSKASSLSPEVFTRLAIAWEANGQPVLRVLDPGERNFRTRGLARRLESDERVDRQRRGPRVWRRTQERGWAWLSFRWNFDRATEVQRRGRRPGSRIGATSRRRLASCGGGPGVRGHCDSARAPRSLSWSGFQDQYRVETVARNNPSKLIYSSDPEQNRRFSGDADASVTLLDVSAGPGRGSGQRPRGKQFTEPSDSGRGRWQLSVQHTAGSLEAVVALQRRRSLAVSTAVLLLLLASATFLLRLSRQAQRLAEVEMEFVAGVSHEFRTPLTVIRTAAYNLRGKIVTNPTQVERYGTLIQQESEKLTAIVEQVLRFASARAGRVIRERTPVVVESLIQNSLQSSKGILEEARCQVELEIEPGLSVVEGDSMALQHAVQNLISNAVKYGSEGGRWIGISARAIAGRSGPGVEIRVADHGPGIPPDEQRHLFDAFFRGDKAVRDQIHGTGLGLNLVKRIVEAHGGTVTVESESGVGTSFIVRLPVSTARGQDELAHSTS